MSIATVSGYTNITPTTGLIAGNSRPVRFTLLNASSVGVSGQAANITIKVVKPSGVTDITDGSITDNGDGTYDYLVLFEEGFNIVIFTWTDPADSNKKIISGALIEAEDMIDSVDEIVVTDLC